MQGNEAKKIIRNYNKLAKVLLEFEVLYHRGWLRQVARLFRCVTSLPALQVEATKSGLQASLLVRHPDTGALYVNFDPAITTLIRETECMARLGLEIPPVARTVRAKQGSLKDTYNALNVSLVLQLGFTLLQMTLQSYLILNRSFFPTDDVG